MAPEGDWERPGSEGVREWQGVAGLLLFWVGGGGAARFFILPWELKPGTGINQKVKSKQEKQEQLVGKLKYVMHKWNVITNRTN